MKNAVETLGYFSRQIAAAFAARGIAVYFVDYEALEETMSGLARFAVRGKTALFTFNFIGLSGEPFFQKDGHYVWEDYEMRYFNILVDHPFYYHKRLAWLEGWDKSKTGCAVKERMTVFCIDKDHAAYIRRFYPGVQAVFLPTAGNILLEEKGYLTMEELPPMEERPIDVVFAGNHVSVTEIERRLDAADAEYRIFYRQMMEDILEHPKRRIEDVMEEHIRMELGAVSERELCQAMAGMAFADVWVRAKSRERILEALAGAGVSMCVLGDGWDYLRKGKRRVKVTGGMVDSAACVRAMRQAKLALNVMPWFQNGAHDRIFTAMLQRSAVLTDGNPYLWELFSDEKELFYYDVRCSEKLAERVKGLLENPGQLQRTADGGFACASKAHTWENRVNALEAFCRNDIRNTNRT